MMMKRLLGLLIIAALALAGLLVEAVPSQAANRFAVCTVTCTWDASSTAMWSITTGGTTGASVPGTSDTAIFDGATCVGGVTCTVTLNAPGNVGAITSGACTASTTGCIIDNSVNNSSFSMTTGGWSNTGTGSRNIKLGSATYTVTSTTCGGLWNWTTATNLTFSAGTSSIVFNGNTVSSGSACSFAFGGQTYNSVSFSGAGNKAGISITGANTFSTLTFVAPGSVSLVSATTQTVGTLNISASNSSPFLIDTASASQATIALTSAATLVDVGFRGIIFTTTTPSATGWDFGNNSGVTITAPSSGGGGGNLLRPGIGQ